MHAHQPDLAAFFLYKAIAQINLMVANRFDFRTRQGYSGLKGFLKMIIVARLAVLADNLNAVAHDDCSPSASNCCNCLTASPSSTSRPFASGIIAMSGWRPPSLNRWRSGVSHSAGVTCSDDPSESGKICWIVPLPND